MNLQKKTLGQAQHLESVNVGFASIKLTEGITMGNNNRLTLQKLALEDAGLGGYAFCLGHHKSLNMRYSQEKIFLCIREFCGYDSPTYHNLKRFDLNHARTFLKKHPVIYSNIWRA